LAIASVASGITMEWAPVGNSGNACDPEPTAYVPGCYGAVRYSYDIGKYEITNVQYTEFRNAKAKSDPFQLYNASMASSEYGFYCGITRTDVSGTYTYTLIAGRESMPVVWMSFYDALRFANWMNNGQGSGDTETGSYTLLSGPRLQATARP